MLCLYWAGLLCCVCVCVCVCVGGECVLLLKLLKLCVCVFLPCCFVLACIVIACDGMLCSCRFGLAVCVFDRLFV